MKPVQKFSAEYLERSRRLPAAAILKFLEEFRRMHAPKVKSRLISVNVPEPLLAAFKRRCEIEGVRYQSQIKKLMANWIISG